MSTHTQGPPDTLRHAHTPGGPEPSPAGTPAESVQETPDATPTAPELPTLGSLPVGARLVLRCRKDWRDATVAFLEPDRVVLSVNSPTGHSYRVRRPPDSLLFLDGHVPVLGEGTPLSWRAGRVRNDARW
ncbi:MAG TPA: hypothetical protein VEQ42_00575 [Pyrinomonadaceae bacterium]|nr:hypothetical protein [Pyrinomonadaceae bacterium]